MAYFPYPSLFPLVFWSFIPRRRRPFTICDAYISIYDSAVDDRMIVKSRALSTILYRLEKRALLAADIVVVDTSRNERRLTKLFGLRPGQTTSFPLTLPERRLLAASTGYDTHQTPTTDVLFFGSISPLHGVAVILEALQEVAAQREISVKIIGDGQHGHLVSEFIKTNAGANVEWIRTWLPLEDLAQAVKSSRICLGVFGGPGKAASVLPLKAYIGLCLGRVVINQDAFSWPSDIPPPPLVTCASTAEALSREIVSLLGNEDHVRRISESSAAYFREHLGHRAILKRWADLLAGRCNLSKESS